MGHINYVDTNFPRTLIGLFSVVTYDQLPLDSLDGWETGGNLKVTQHKSDYV
jgi:hypothetical protein